LPFLFFLSPLNQEKFIEKNRKKRKHVYDGKKIKIHITFFKKKPYNLPYLDNITGGLQGDYLKTDLYA